MILPVLANSLCLWFAGGREWLGYFVCLLKFTSLWKLVYYGTAS